MPEYESTGYNPPAPVARVTVIGDGEPVVDVPLLIDTGADGSVIPRTVALLVGADLTPAADLIVSYTGERLHCEQATLTVKFERVTVKGPFLVVDTEQGVLGRNVLNSLVLVMDGPGLYWNIGGR
jgi:predicted aspartyl protease